MAKLEYPDYPYLYMLALVAGRTMVDSLESDLAHIKKDGTPVMPADKKINNFVIKSIAKDFSSVAVIGEEQSYKLAGAKYKVTVDPIDGTIPHWIGMPVATFYIAVIDVELCVPLTALIYDPFCRRMWHAIRGQGTFMNGRKVKVSQRKTVKGSKLGVFWGWRGCLYNLSRAETRLKEAEATCFNPLSVAYLGGFTASGRMEGTIFPASHIWETAPMQLIVEGAGGKATDIRGKELRYGPNNTVDGHIISNGLFHNELVEIVASCL